MCILPSVGNVEVVRVLLNGRVHSAIKLQCRVDFENISIYIHIYLVYVYVYIYIEDNPDILLYCLITKNNLLSRIIIDLARVYFSLEGLQIDGR